VDKFCYLGDTLSVDGDADAAVEARIRIGWNKFRQLVPSRTKGRKTVVVVVVVVVAYWRNCFDTVDWAT